MEKIVRKTLPQMSGPQKAAILLAELGPMYNDNYDELLEALHLTNEETKLLRMTMKGLAKYNPVKHGIEEIQREEAVLSEAIEFGKRRGIFKPIPQDQLRTASMKTDVSNGVSQLAKQDPEAVAKILSSWLGD